MVLNLVREDLKKLLDKNAILMAFMALIFTFISSFVGGNEENSKALFELMKIEGILILFLMFLTELAKSTLVNDKISKKIEFILANGVNKWILIKKYIISLFVAVCIILTPSLIVSFLNINVTILLILNFVISSILYTGLVVLIILYTVNMNKINGLQIQLLILSILIIGLCFTLYNFLNVLELYLICKFFILTSILASLGINTKNERIVVSYY